MNVIDEVNYEKCHEILCKSVSTLNKANFVADITKKNRKVFEEGSNQFLLEMRIGRSTSSLNNFSTCISKILKELNSFKGENERCAREVNSLRNFIIDNYKGIRRIMLIGNPKGFIEDNYIREYLGEYKYKPKCNKSDKPASKINKIDFTKNKSNIENKSNEEDSYFTRDYSQENNVYTLKKLYYDGVQLSKEQIEKVKELERQEYINSHKSDYSDNSEETFNDNGLHCDDRITYGIACAFGDI